MGPIYGEGDSLITLLSLVGMPPQRTYLFLGCYFGLGFAPLESLLLLFCLKCLYPSKIYLLKGHLEEPASIKVEQTQWLVAPRRHARGIDPSVHGNFQRTVAQMPIGAMIGPKILCLPGGPGPIIREQGLAVLRNCTRSSMSQLDRSMCMEAAWAVMKLESNPVAVNDGIPTFTESQCSAFCKANGLVLLVRGRQLVDEGFLNYPKEVLTIVSAVAYLDNFRNYAAAITFQGLNVSLRFSSIISSWVTLYVLITTLSRTAISSFKKKEEFFSFGEWFRYNVFA
uniref:SER_THR_PHOSPHATASE domain-containing protein n=1 Tax=Angiostrongylus cantonensis TaxID=6313 RepID=A0A0K0DAS8_ANGCA